MTRLLLSLALLSGARTAAACGALFTSSTASAISSDFRAVMVPGDSTTTWVVQTAYSGDATAFTWVLPIPGLVHDSQAGTVSTESFSQLINATDPRFTPSDDGGGGCAAGKSDAGFNSRGGGGVEVLQVIDAGVYDLTVLDADVSADLTGWLTEQGYSVPAAAEAALDAYAADGWYFLAVRVDGAAVAGEVTGLPALAFTLDSTRTVFPLAVSATSAAEEIGVAVFTLASSRWQPVEGYATPELGDRYEDDPGDFSSWYEDKVREAQGGGRAWVLEYAGDLGEAYSGATASDTAWYGYSDATPMLDELVAGGLLSQAQADDAGFVTRYRAFLSPALLTDDLSLEDSGDLNAYAVDMTDEAPGCAGLLPPGLLLLIAGGWPLHRRRRARRG